MKGIEDDRDPFHGAIEDRDFRTAAKHARDFVHAKVEGQDRAALDAHLFHRGLTLIDEPGTRWPMVVSLSLAAEQAELDAAAADDMKAAS